MAEEKKNQNLNFWNSVGTTEVAHTKKVTQGRRSFSAIDAYYQIKTATEKFGMFGDGWGVRDPHFQVVVDVLLVYNAIMFWNYDGKQGEIPIESSVKLYMGKDRDTGAPKIDDDCVKKVVTDALTKGLSKLGFNADVFLGKFDDNKYVADLESQQKAEGNAELKPKLISVLSVTDDFAQVTKIWTENPGLKNDPEFIQAIKDAGARLKPPVAPPADDPASPSSAPEGAA